MKTAARLLVLPVLFAICYLLFAFVFKTPVFATPTSNVATANVAAQQQGLQPTSNQYLTPVTNPDVPKNMHTYTQSVVIELMTSALCQLTGYDPLSPNHKCLGIDPVTNKIGFVENGGGLIGATGGLIATTYYMPTSTSNYINYLAGNFGLTKKTYAASSCSTDRNGVGFCSIKPLTKIWVAIRDIVYLLFTVIFIIIGLAIMLRVHIDPRTVMTIENQIPKIIIGIVLVTFSLAIAGLLIDVMYVAIYLIGDILTKIDPNLIDRNTYSDIATSGSPISAKDYFDTDVIGGVANGISNMITENLRIGITIPIIDKDLGQIVVYLILFLLLLLAFWIALLRLWISLIMAYIMILLDIVFAPFWFLAGLLPGGSLGIGAWFRDIMANLAVFPTAIAMFALAIIFGKIGDNATKEYLFNPPLVGGAEDVFTFGQLIMFGFIFMAPQALSIVKAAFKAPKFNIGPVFAPAGAAAGVIKSGAAGAWQSQQTMLPPAEKKYGIRGVIMRKMGGGA